MMWKRRLPRRTEAPVDGARQAILSLGGLVLQTDSGQRAVVLVVSRVQCGGLQHSCSADLPRCSAAGARPVNPWGSLTTWLLPGGQHGVGVCGQPWTWDWGGGGSRGPIPPPRQVLWFVDAGRGQSRGCPNSLAKSGQVVLASIAPRELFPERRESLSDGRSCFLGASFVSESSRVPKCAGRRGWKRPLRDGSAWERRAWGRSAAQGLLRLGFQF